MKRLLNTLDRAPLYWIALSLGLLVFGLNRVAPGGTHHPGETEQALLDRAFVEAIRTGGDGYALVPGSPQTFGAHVLPQALRAVVAFATGDADRAGIWLSLAGAVATLAGLYILAIRILPLRGFAVSTVMAAGALGPLHAAISPDPSTALGMALVVWGMAFFLTAITESAPADIFASGFLFGLAGYVRMELSLIWVFLAAYLLVLQVVPHAKEKRDAPPFALALGGLFTVLLMLWPMMNRNLDLAGTPVLPGYDADLILGAPAMAGSAMPDVPARLLAGFRLLTLDPSGPGVYAGLLWPAGMMICLFIGLHRKLPVFWIPVLLGTLLGMTGLSFVTGWNSYRETLHILTPMLFPFAVLPFAFVVQTWMQMDRRSPAAGRWVWIGVGVGVLALIQTPRLLRDPAPPASSGDALVEDVAALPPSTRNGLMLSDRPGALVNAGKFNVIGTRGQTDWSILTTASFTGRFRPEALLEYLRVRQVTLLHLANPEDPLVDRLRLVEGAPEITALDQASPPHRLFRISWP